MKKYILAAASIASCCLLVNLSFTAFAQPTQTVLAIVNGRSITTATLQPFLPPGFESFEPEKAIAVQKVALDNAIISEILKVEARRRKISVPLLRKQMTAGRVRVADSQVEGEYQKNARYFGMLSPDEAKEKLRLALEAEARIQLYKSALSRIRTRYSVRYTLQSNPREALSLRGSGPSKGPDSAAVTLTVFSDFECPYCNQSNDVLDRLLSEFPESVRLVFRFLPLKGVSGDLTPSVAAFCAGAQGSFWTFHDLIYKERIFGAAELRRAAMETELDMERFDQCVLSDLPKRAIAADIAEARRLKIDGTPTFVVNGKIYKGMLEFDEFKKIIEGEIGSMLTGRNP